MIEVTGKKGYLGDRTIMSDNGLIKVVDYKLEAGDKCVCGNDAKFTVIIGDVHKHVCTRCLADLGKNVIEALY